MSFALFAAACVQCGTGRDREIEPIVFGIRDRLTPEGGRGVAFSGVRWDRSGVHASWEVETGMNWPAYAAWVKGRIPADFKVVAETDSSLTLGKQMPGDYYSLRLTAVPSTRPLRIRAAFDGGPY